MKKGANEHRSQYRLPDALYIQLKDSATKNHRSINAELVARLESTFPRLLVSVDATGKDIRDEIVKLSLGDVMTSDEINGLALRILELIEQRR
jgi:hypothetical protein